MKNFTFIYNVCNNTIAVEAPNVKTAFSKAKAEAFARKLNAMPDVFRLVRIKGGI